MNIEELKQRLKEIEQLEHHLKLIPVNTRIAFVNAHNLSGDSFSLDKTIFTVDDQKEFIKIYIAKVSTKIEILKEKLDRDTSVKY